MAIAAEEVFKKTMTKAQRKKAAALAKKLIAEQQTLQDLRKARQQTQVALAEKLGKKQVTIAQMEKRSDMLISTLRDYITAMGGKLNLVVEFPDRDPVVLDGLSTDDETSPSKV
ncbi:MAG: transcriptional regulator [Pseudomonadota bacterium]